MVLRNFIYYNNGKKTKIDVKICLSLWHKFWGLMFRRKSPALLFTFNRKKNLIIHSFFCKPFTAIWLDEKKNALKIKEISGWKFYISGFGKYLLEIPKRTTLK